MRNTVPAVSLLLFSVCALATPSGSGHFQQAPQIPAVDPRCQISTSTTDIDYGLQSRWQMQDVDGRRQAVTPGKRQLSVTVVCPYTHNMRLKVMGGRTVRGEFRYGASGELQVRVTGAQLDGRDVPVALTSSAGALLGAPQEILTLLPDQTFSAVSGNLPSQGKTFNVRLEIQPVLTDNDARVSSRQANGASVSFELMD
ncbi:MULTISPECIES: fimbrial protein [unclassified Enterobacter cloacae complex]|uniref:fimbrial protein n=1 Tax=unclassified Enterobacter cloacae complex TaxID=2757714 RepID=UPI001872A1C4|nr:MULTISPECIES: fimbrial protein [unclassified Enterobacter cloacae complex]MBE4810065.1 fimbrial protein [Enterobacter cloacae complex sp. P44RS]MBE4827951.1 fimbrial protein [Enterobacter cloacae complex sp. P42RS]MBE4836257.1 fimbrial protein [Enterobacter cloacae complex sp. P46RS]MBE4839842.1 fimbrial protein [Enterobacter cloacae complex sp. P42C]